VTEAEEKVKQIRANIMTAQSRQKNYIDKRRRPLEFEVGDHERCTSLRHQRKASPPPRYSDLYPIIDKFWSLSYQVELPSKLSVPIGAGHDIQGLSYQDFGPTRPSYPQQDHMVLQGSME
jgi:hypothetical protein